MGSQTQTACALFFALVVGCDTNPLYVCYEPADDIDSIAFQGATSKDQCKEFLLRLTTKGETFIPRGACGEGVLPVGDSLADNYIYCWTDTNKQYTYLRWIERGDCSKPQVQDNFYIIVHQFELRLTNPVKPNSRDPWGSLMVGMKLCDVSLLEQFCPQVSEPPTGTPSTPSPIPSPTPPPTSSPTSSPTSPTPSPTPPPTQLLIRSPTDSPAPIPDYCFCPRDTIGCGCGECGDHKEITLQVCKQTDDLTINDIDYKFDSVVSKSNRPPGCIVSNQVVYFNNYTHGIANTETQPLCKRGKPQYGTFKPTPMPRINPPTPTPSADSLWSSTFATQSSTPSTPSTLLPSPIPSMSSSTAIHDGATPKLILTTIAKTEMLSSSTSSSSTSSSSSSVALVVSVSVSSTSSPSSSPSLLSSTSSSSSSSSSASSLSSSSSSSLSSTSIVSSSSSSPSSLSSSSSSSPSSSSSSSSSSLATTPATFQVNESTGESGSTTVIIAVVVGVVVCVLVATVIGVLLLRKKTSDSKTAGRVITHNPTYLLDKPDNGMVVAPVAPV